MASKNKITSSRKLDHINLAVDAQMDGQLLDERFIYEPLLGVHPGKEPEPFSFLGKKMRIPLWISSMTGGTEKAQMINRQLAKACGEFGMGMGLGSCRSLLYSEERLADFDWRKTLGEEVPFFANLGVAQVEQLIVDKELDRIDRMVKLLGVDGLIVHVNPLQEWFQPEGDRFSRFPVDTIKELIKERPDLSIIVKEVGQGMGKASLKALLQLPIAAIELGAAGGTNFTKLEMLRQDNRKVDAHFDWIKTGHTASQMVDWINELVDELGDKVQCRSIIASGGVRSYLDGYYLVKKCKLPTVYGQASMFLIRALDEYPALAEYVTHQIEGYRMAEAFLKIRK